MIAPRGGGGGRGRGGWRGVGRGDVGVVPTGGGGRIVQQMRAQELPGTAGAGTSAISTGLPGFGRGAGNTSPPLTGMGMGSSAQASMSILPGGLGGAGFGSLLADGLGRGAQPQANFGVKTSNISSAAHPFQPQSQRNNNNSNNNNNRTATASGALNSLPATLSAALPGHASTFTPQAAVPEFFPQQGLVQPNRTFEQQLFERASQAQMGVDPLTMGRGRGRRQQGRTLSDFFASEHLRADLATRAAQSTLMLDPDDPQNAFTPERVHEFHTLFPLDSNVDEMGTPLVGSLSCASRVFKAVSELDGGTYALRKLDGVRITSDHNAMRKQWAEITHPNIVRLRNIFITNEFNGQSNALTFVHDFIFGAMTLEERHMRGDAIGGISEDIIWSYVAQLTAAIRYLHSRGKAVRCLHASKVLVTPQHRVYINCCGIIDVVGDKKMLVPDQQAEDLRALGTLLLETVCRSIEAATTQNLAASIDYVATHYHPDLKDFIVYCISQPGSAGQVTIFTACARIAGRLLEQLDYTYQHIDACHKELSKEIQCGRLFRLLTKLNMILERPDPNNTEENAWAETGDRYLLKLYRDYVFHQRDEDNTPIVDLGAIVQSLNKLDVGTSEKITLMSRDEQTILIVSYADLKACAERSFTELLQQGNYQQSNRAPLPTFGDSTQFTSLDFAAGGAGGMRMYGGGGVEQQWAAPVSVGRGKGR